MDNTHLETVLSLLEEVSLKPLPEDIPDFVRKTNVLPAVDEESGIRVDFIFSFTPYEVQAIKRALRVNMRDQDVMYASVEDLIIHKIFSGRPRGLEDVRSVLRKNCSVDMRYIEDWLAKFDEVSEEDDFLGTFQRIIPER